MLIQLTINNLALIRQVTLTLGPGLNVLTGETGAGKSIVVDAMNLLVGGRASAELVRTNEERALVEGLFDCSGLPCLADRLAELGFPPAEDGTLLLSRELVRGGRGLCRIDGRAVPLGMYRSIGELLVDLHGQHEHQSLLKVEGHLDLLDRYGGAGLQQQRRRVAELYRRLADLNREYRRLSGSEEEVKQRIDYLQHAIDEIGRLKPRPGEDLELQQERERLRFGEKISELTREVAAVLYEGEGGLIPAYDLLSRAVRQAGEMSRYDQGAAAVAAVLEEILYRLEDAVQLLRDYRERLEFDPARGEEVEERLYTLSNLMRKYGSTLEEVCAYRDQAAAELEELCSRRERSQEIEEELRRVRREYDQEAVRLGALRRERGRRLVEEITAQLRDLGMPEARFDLGWDKLGSPTAGGYDRVEFLFSANPGEPVKPLAKIASGGEMSRVMLALKVVLAESDEIPTLVFDEIDSGIGGRTLQAVAEKLQEVGRSKQVLCVTHSPQIAGRGESHYFIEKSVADGETITQVHRLQEQERVDELVRMLGGNEKDPVARSHAERLLGLK